MKLKFDPNLEFQIEAIDSIGDLFKGQIKQSLGYTFQVVPNVLTLSKDKILENLKEIQEKNELPVSESLEGQYNFTVEMETGTGKTYIYLRSILELNQKYGFAKFIIVVPSVAIKEGVLKTLEITKDHFRGLYNNLPYTYFTYKSNNLAQIRMFAQDTNLQIMVLTRDAFNKDINIIHNTHDRMGDKPIELIKQTKPIVILDEPQKMEGEATKWGISELNPLFILRYSATHREIHNLVYKLTPYNAYNMGLVKKIEVLSITEEGDPSSKKIILERIDSVESGLRAKVKVFVKETGGIKFKTKTLKHGDDLMSKTKNPYYDGFKILEINKGTGYIQFSNGVKVYVGKSSIEEDRIMRFMVRETIREHLEKKRLNEKGLKVLSLFFIKRVDDYLPEDSLLKKIFEEEFKELVEKDFQEFSKIDASSMHSGYFSKMRSTKGIERDEEAYELIMRKKEELLSLDNPVEFIFSHSALREGWDNPNVFNICTLAYSSSEIKKRQEIGRGLRLPVNQDGERIQDREINLLTVITNENYRDYLEELQTEFREEVGGVIPPIEEHRERKELKIKKDALESDLFKGLWNRISKKAKYVVDIDTERFIEKCIEEINEIEVRAPEISIQKVSIEKIDEETLEEKFVRERSEEIQLKRIPNMIRNIAEETNLTRHTVFKILNRIDNLSLLFKNPQEYVERISNIIKYHLKEMSVENISYFELREEFDVKLFTEEIRTYDKYITTINQKKTIYEVEGEDKDAVIISIGPSEEGISQIEKKFTKNLDKDSRIKFFIKLPDWYEIATPAGNYTPDWAIIVGGTEDGNPRDKIYFVVETKGTTDLNQLRPVERMKIKSASKRFEIVDDVKFLAPIDSFDNFARCW